MLLIILNLINLIHETARRSERVDNAVCQVLFHTKYQAKWWKGPFFARSQDSKQDTSIGKSAKTAEAYSSIERISDSNDMNIISRRNFALLELSQEGLSR